jgi:hypothetical protein
MKLIELIVSIDFRLLNLNPIQHLISKTEENISIATGQVDLIHYLCNKERSTGTKIVLEVGVHVEQLVDYLIISNGKGKGVKVGYNLLLLLVNEKCFAKQLLKNSKTVNLLVRDFLIFVEKDEHLIRNILSTMLHLFKHNVKKGVKYLKEKKKHNNFMECLKKKSRWENGEEFCSRGREQVAKASEGRDVNISCRLVLYVINNFYLI